MSEGWRHTVLILGLGLLAVLGFAVVPPHAYDKLGNAFEVVMADPIGATGGAVALGSILGAMVAAYRRALRTPVPETRKQRRERETDPEDL